MSPKAPVSPDAAWQALREGNDRFVAGAMEHPSQGVDHRREVSVRQYPFAVIFGCSDSRVGAELIFDRGPWRRTRRAVALARRARRAWR